LIDGKNQLRLRKGDCKMKRALSFVLTLTMLMSLFAMPTSAATAPKQETGAEFQSQSFTRYSIQSGSIKQENWTTEQITSRLRNLGVSESEIKYLLKLEKERERNFRLPATTGKITLMARFPSNPSIGDRYTTQIKVGVATTSLSLQALVVKFVSKGIPLAAAIGVAEAIISDYTDIKGVVFTVDYIYGYDNDNQLNWVYSKVDWDFYY